ncbi:hypothetical protein EHM92_01885 [bacterium]|nr:MAG: hypothetical protein EHM92_01885 [bacterium]
MAGLLAEGHRYLNLQVKNPAPEPPKHARYYADEGGASAYVSDLLEGARTLSFLYQMTGDVRYARKGAELALAICDLEDWVNPAHKFDIIYPRVWPKNVPNDQVVFSYDITASGRAIALSTAYDWLYPALTKGERDKIRGALLEKAITRVRGNYEFFWWSTAYRCNWSAVCYSGLGIAAMSLLTEHPQLVDVISECQDRMSLTFDQIGEEGSWQEGRGYYSYMLRHSVMFMDALKRLTHGKCDLFAHEKLHRRPLDFILYSLTANFEDSEGEPLGPTSMANKLVEETGNHLGAWYRDHLLKDGTDIFDILWPRSSVTPIAPTEQSKFFHVINWAIMRSDFLDPSTVTIACKAGFNDDPHHGHLDCGQFILTWHTVPFIRDIGRMRYDELYFNEDRWLYPFASSSGHNLVFVNGEQQIPAKLKDQPWKDGVGGPILRFQTSATRDYVLMEPTGAYPGKELKKWRRSIVLEKPAITVVLDEVTARPGSVIEARFFPGAQSTPARSTREQGFPPRPAVTYAVSKNCVLLTSQGHHMAAIPAVLDNSYRIVEDRLPTIPVIDNARLEWIPYFETVLTATSQVSIIATLFLPVNDKQDADTVARNAYVRLLNSHELEVGIAMPSHTYRWSFTREPDGFVLKN